MTKYFLTLALAGVTTLSLSAQVGIGTKNPEGVLDVVAGAKGKDDKTVEAAFVLPRVSSVSKVVNLQEGKDKPAEGSLVFDQSKQCLRYYYLKEKDKPETGGWSPCIASSNDHSPEPDPTPDPSPTDPLAPITFRTCGKDLTYGKVQSPKTGRIWLDRNLGATKAVTENIRRNDKMARGSLYQWGRGNDGHECVDWSVDPPKMSETTDKKATSDKVGHSKFITDNSFPSIWKDPMNLALWQKDAAGNIPNNPCPKGFRVPTMKEFENEISQDDRKVLFLKFLPSPYRHSRDAKLIDLAVGSYWQMSWAADTSYGNSGRAQSYYVMMDSTEDSLMISNPGTSFAMAQPVRCINDQ